LELILFLNLAKGFPFVFPITAFISLLLTRAKQSIFLVDGANMAKNSGTDPTKGPLGGIFAFLGGMVGALYGAGDW
jgi:hypothetical protein